MSLTFFTKSSSAPVELSQALPEQIGGDDVLWIDLVQPNQYEEALVEQVFGIDVPTDSERSAIEESARFYIDNQVLVLHSTVVARVKPTAIDDMASKSLGIRHKREIVSFFVTKSALITVRNCALRAFEANAGRASADLSDVETGPDVLLALLESLVERVADFLSASAQELEALNLRILVGRRSIRVEVILKRLGQLGAGASQSRDSLSSMSRLIRFAIAHGGPWSMPKDRLHLLATDIETLQRQGEALTNDLTFFLDATLGLVNARQNEILKVMAIVTLLFAPPTLLASFFGMNFQHMSVFADPSAPYWATALMIASSVVIYSLARLGKWL
ncbi:CorA family divalent cation transporter [Candidatus Phycosocius spiralis]|uniref:Magnesium transport protein CorA n=1 Tax=Candidatus Phycosocius spiralis TaxID=2815099 RepID=A0ABQ4PXI7_9PROT|nr:CorA family divalent cation transporter [Candidatus Phycosocius spiralis]GIU67398.1 magnesium transport protein CorA [Candidatus Phycosocius spiralis]